MTQQQQKINKMYKFTTKGSTQEELLKTIKENNQLIDMENKKNSHGTLFILFLIGSIYIFLVGFDGLQENESKITMFIIEMMFLGFTFYHYIKYVYQSIEINKLINKE